ncbi:UDP-glucose 4-epimerase family protein [Allorhizobium pseudoryzae]|uniref:UDP-glucose 4-epimerase family protein n=1 Tax=Allorhizobium pseudoryzae TaxID=379684 RepID=UPI003D01F80E
MILVTGATGFVGRHLCEDLAQRGMPFRPVSRKSLPDHLTIPDINAATDWSAALHGVDCVIHLAARVHVMREREADPLAAFRAMNVEATLNLARQAAKAGVRRFVYVSSIKVNGETTAEGRPFQADDTPAPQDPYGRSKAEAEQSLLELGEQTGLEIVIIRPPLVYGPGVGANFRLLMRWAASGIPSPFGCCRNSRSLVYVGNLTDLLIAAAHHPAAAGQVFLVSDGEDLSTKDLFQMMAGLQGKRALSLPLPVTAMEAAASLVGKASLSDRLLKNLEVDIAKTEAVLAWKPHYSVKQGLQRTIFSGARQE